ncbi:DNA polymerase III subunit alpha [Rathayibacter rathayi]|uniref:DNA-directed DNA polymerase n=1 Tax=Rathayibacter rathayi TaxID=33887 RepID=A0ABX5AEH5_RATRA|nr:DNA polymerase III subunit alpha [Rathayibacter rathayi]PPF23115.1 DNA polymerase III subunit alpha [Rathayibacter rathayi]PPF51633.1 DNA polymerase III subunit alpha [Rathayibacter rathayi]PPF83223.1 DNA polymerase III subunit alpha [Rathayibacter rathayi]PPG47054.1 DNA polymerase III subunit alpha [Rathayibacter rathayi]PPG94077.1 DNA polymerase III subunit alpha [Rathayibacter rathayi]
MTDAASPSRYVSLHTHSEHSELDSLAKISDLFARTAELGQPALAITDHGTLGGLWKAQKAADLHGVKLIPGIEAYLAIGDRFQHNQVELADGELADDSDDSAAAADDEAGGHDENGEPKPAKARTKTKKYEHLTLLAVSETGWRNLVRINNAAQKTKWGKYARIDYALVKQHAEGVVILSGCLGGPILGPLSRGDYSQAEANLLKMIATVGRENVYIEVMEHGIESESAILHLAAQLAQEYGIPLVATNDSHHTHAHDADAHDAWLAVSTKALVSDQKRYRFSGTGYHHRSEEEMLDLRPEAWWAEAIANTMLVADRVEGRILPRPTPKLPAFPTPDGLSGNLRYYHHLVTQGAIARYGDLTLRPDVRARLNEELAIIRDAGFIDYFLIVQDVVAWARANSILVGPGRGSGAGSITAYCLGITGLCPLENSLLFERFLEPGRPDFPDFDVDFEALRRADILDYLQRKWGPKSVALIGAFGSAKTKQALKSAARVLEAGSVGDKLAKVVPIAGGNPFTFAQLEDLTLGEADPFRDQLAKLGEKGEDVVALARQFAGTVSGVSIHACGVIVSDLDLTDLIPLRIDSKTGRWVSQWDSKDVEAFGLLKLDILSLRNLDIAHQAITFIYEQTGEQLDFDRMPHPNTQGDPRVDAAFRTIREGRTAGLFQLESPKMTELAQDVGPTNLRDLSALVALFRPGPLSAGMDQHYARRKNGRDAVDYSIFTDDPREQDVIASVLGDTFGTCIFQEQLMSLGRVMAGFDVDARGLLRRAVGKKDKVKMAEVGQMFIAGCVQDFRDPITGEITSPAMSERTALVMWEAMKGSGEYLFNASHSAAYAQLAYITAYLKANWPAAYGAAILAVTEKPEKRQQALRSLPEEGIEVLAPDVNRSGAHSRPEGPTSVRLGLKEIKGVGDSGERIARVREESGKLFTSLTDVANRVRQGGSAADGSDSLKYLPTNHLEGLVEAGALDEFGPRMGQHATARIAKTGNDILPPPIEWGYLERSARQRQRLLVSLGTHPLIQLHDEVSAWRHHREAGGRSFHMRASAVEEVPNEDGASVTVLGLLGRYAEKPYRGGQMAGLTIEGPRASVEAVMWNDTVEATKMAGTMPNIGGVLAVSARVKIRVFESEDDEGNIVETTEHQLQVNQVYPVPVHDPVQGNLPPTDIPRIAFATAPRPQASRKTAAKAPAPVPAQAEPAPEPSPVRVVDSGLRVLVARPYDGSTDIVRRNGLMPTSKLAQRVLAFTGTQPTLNTWPSEHGASFAVIDTDLITTLAVIEVAAETG